MPLSSSSSSLLEDAAACSSFGAVAECLALDDVIALSRSSKALHRALHDKNCIVATWHCEACEKVPMLQWGQPPGRSCPVCSVKFCSSCGVQCASCREVIRCRSKKAELDYLHRRLNQSCTVCRKDYCQTCSPPRGERSDNALHGMRRDRYSHFCRHCDVACIICNVPLVVNGERAPRLAAQHQEENQQEQGEEKEGERFRICKLCQKHICLDCAPTNLQECFQGCGDFCNDAMRCSGGVECRGCHQIGCGECEPYAGLYGTCSECDGDYCRNCFFEGRNVVGSCSGNGGEGICYECVRAREGDDKARCSTCGIVICGCADCIEADNLFDCSFCDRRVCVDSKCKEDWYTCEEDGCRWAACSGCRPAVTGTWNCAACPTAYCPTHADDQKDDTLATAARNDETALRCEDCRVRLCRYCNMRPKHKLTCTNCGKVKCKSCGLKALSRKCSRCSRSASFCRACEAPATTAWTCRGNECSNKTCHGFAKCATCATTDLCHGCAEKHEGLCWSCQRKRRLERPAEDSGSDDDDDDDNGGNEMLQQGGKKLKAPTVTSGDRNLFNDSDDDEDDSDYG